MSTPLVRNRIHADVYEILRANQPSLSSPSCSHAEKRKGEAERIRQKYPDRIPVSTRSTLTPRSLPNSYRYRTAMSGILTRSFQVICEKADRTDIPTIDKKKYLVPSVCSVYSDQEGYQETYIWILCALGSDSRPIRVCYSEANQACTGEGHFHLRRGSPATNSATDECHIRRAQVRIYLSNIICISLIAIY